MQSLPDLRNRKKIRSVSDQSRSHSLLFLIPIFKLFLEFTSYIYYKQDLYLFYGEDGFIPNQKEYCYRTKNNV